MKNLIYLSKESKQSPNVIPHLIRYFNAIKLLRVWGHGERSRIIVRLADWPLTPLRLTGRQPLSPNLMTLIRYLIPHSSPLKLKPFHYLLVFLLICMSTSCEKFLDIKPDKKLAVPSDKLSNLKLLLDDTFTMNQQYPSMGEVASDNVYIHDSMWESVYQASATAGNSYLWNTDVFNDSESNDWSASYAAVFNANLALEGTAIIQKNAANEAEWNQVKGSALFFRAYAFYALLQEFAKPYQAATAAQDPGIVLKLNTDINERSRRASLEQCYDQLVRDLEQAAALLPVNTAFKTEPSRPAAYAMLARTLLTMSEYSKALEYAEKSIQLYPTLMDFSTLDPSAPYPVPMYNQEVIFHATLMVDRAHVYPYGRIDGKLYDQYADNDLRKTLFFEKHGPDDIAYRGSYDGSYSPFGGIASDEVYLIAAECYVRTGNKDKGLDMLNTLLAKRWDNTFTPLSAGTDQQALEVVLTERRKELLLRNLRWTDLNRLNFEPAFQKTIEKVSLGKTYLLTPQKRYVFFIPQLVIDASGMAQN